jgi:GDP-4-dehydro-6-deoxy-D-mannose reductase
MRPSRLRRLRARSRASNAGARLLKSPSATSNLHDVRDTVRAYAAIVERGVPGRVYNVCAGQTYKIRDVLDRLVAMSRVPVAIRVDVARYRPSDNPVLLGDRTRIEREIGWTPEISLDQTLSDLLDYWRNKSEDLGREP